MTIVNGKDYNGDDFNDPNNLYGFGNGGHKEIVAPATDPNYIQLAADIIEDGTNSLQTTSSTSVTFGTGSKTFTMDAARPFLAGQSVRIIDQNDTTQYMAGTVTSWDNGTFELVINVVVVIGGGSSDSWKSTLDGARGQTGEISTADFQNLTNVYVVATGSANAYILTPGIALSSYSNGSRFVFNANFTNTGAATVNISGLGAKDIYFNGAPLSGNEILSGQIVEIVYNGVEFNIISGISLEALYGQSLLLNQVFS